MIWEEEQHEIDEYQYEIDNEVEYYKDPQEDIDNRVEQFFGRESSYIEEDTESVRYMDYNEGYEDNFDWDLFENMAGHEND